MITWMSRMSRRYATRKTGNKHWQSTRTQNFIAILRWKARKTEKKEWQCNTGEKKNSLCYAIPKYNGSKMHFGQPFSATLYLNELWSFKWNLCVYQTDFDILKFQVGSEAWLRANKRNDVYIPQPRCIDDLAFLPWGSRSLVRILAYLLIYYCTVFRSLAVFWECVPLYCILSCQITAARQGLESSTAAPVNRSCWSRLKREVFNAGIIFPSLWSNCPRSVPAIRAQF